VRRLAPVLSLALAACPSSDDDDLDLPPRVFDDDDAGDDDDDSAPDYIECGAPDAAPPYVSSLTTELSTLVPQLDARALGWAIDAAAYDFHGQLSGSLELSLFAFSDDDCPARTAVTSPLEPDPRCVETTRNTRASSHWAGGCVGTCEFEIVGAADFALRRLDCLTPDGPLREREGTAASPGLEVGVLVRHLGGVSRFGLDGDLRHLHRESTAAGGAVTVEEEWSVDAVFTALPGPPKGFLADLWRQGSGTGAASGARSAVYVDGEPTAVAATAAGGYITGGVLAPMEAEFDLAWDSAVCALEPVRGSVIGRRWDQLPPEGTPQSAASIVFDGATDCDGCGRVYSGDAEVGEFCRAPAPSPPPLD